MNPVRQVAQLGQDGLEPVPGLAEGGGRRRVGGLGHRRREAGRDAQQVLLHAIVQVTLQAPPLGELGLDDPRARGLHLLKLFAGGLGLQLGVLQGQLAGPHGGVEQPAVPGQDRVGDDDGDAARPRPAGCRRPAARLTARPSPGGWRRTGREVPGWGRAGCCEARCAASRCRRPAQACAVSSVTFLIRSSRWTMAIRNATGIAKSATLSARNAPLGVVAMLDSVITAAVALAAITAAMPATMIGVMTMRSTPLARTSRIARSTISVTPKIPSPPWTSVAEHVGQRLVGVHRGPPPRRGAAHPRRRRGHDYQRAAGDHPGGQRDKVAPLHPRQRGIGVTQQRPRAEHAVYAAEHNGVRGPRPIPGVDEIDAAEYAREHERHRGDGSGLAPGRSIRPVKTRTSGERQVDRGERGRMPPQRPLHYRAETRGNEDEGYRWPARRSTRAAATRWNRAASPGPPGPGALRPGACASAAAQALALGSERMVPCMPIRLPAGPYKVGSPSPGWSAGASRIREEILSPSWRFPW